MDPTASSYILWMLVVALVIYGLAGVWRLGLRRVVLVTSAPPMGPGIALPFLSLAAFLVGLSVLMLIMEPVHFRDDVRYEDVVAAWRASLLFVAGLTAAGGFLSGLLGTSAVQPALAMGLPPAVYGAFAWAAYGLLTSFVPPDDPLLGEELSRYAKPVMTLVTSFPLVAFGASLLAGRVGRALRERVLPAPDAAAPLRSVRAARSSRKAPSADGSLVDEISNTIHEEGLAEIDPMIPVDMEVEKGPVGRPSVLSGSWPVSGPTLSPRASSHSYEMHWADLRKRRRAFWLVLLAFPVAVAILTPHWVFGILWSFVVLILGFRAQIWPCPRCGKPYFLEDHRASYDMPFASKWWAQKCLHCGLAKWSSGQEDDRGSVPPTE